MKRLMLTLLFVLAPALHAQTVFPPWTVDLKLAYGVVPNVTYSVASNYECKLDVYCRNPRGAPAPTVIYIHGGGWVAGTKEGALFDLLPWFALGFNVVNVEYRMARVSPPPAAVEDCRLALRWVYANARQYGFDTTKIVVTGGSAGGHLALMTGMLDAAAGFDAPKEWDETSHTMNVAAIVNWFGITDVLDEIHGPNIKGYAVVWIGDQPNADEIAKRVSPINMVLKSNPPIITIHGDHDEVVPYSQAVRLKEELDKAGVPNQLYTVAGGGHGGFSPEEMQKIWATIRQFLNQNLKTPAAQ